MSRDRKLAEIRKFCRAHADPAVVAKYEKYFTEGYDAFGVPSLAMEAQRDAWLAKRADLGRDGFLNLGDRLVTTGKYEEAGPVVRVLREAVAMRDVLDFTELLECEGHL